MDFDIPDGSYPTDGHQSRHSIRGRVFDRGDEEALRCVRSPARFTVPLYLLENDVKQYE